MEKFLSHFETLQSIAEYYINSGLNKEAKKILNIYPYTTFRKEMLAGKIEFSRQNFRGAYDFFKKAYETNKIDLELLSYLIQACEKLGLFEEAYSYIIDSYIISSKFKDADEITSEFASKLKNFLEENSHLSPTMEESFFEDRLNLIADFIETNFARTEKEVYESQAQNIVEPSVSGSGEIKAPSLNDIPFFANLISSQKLIFMENLKTYSIKKDHKISLQGKKEKSIYFIINGKIGYGKYKFSKGDLFNEYSFFSPSYFHDNVMAEEDCTLALLDHKDLQSICESDERLKFHVYWNFLKASGDKLNLISEMSRAGKTGFPQDNNLDSNELSLIDNYFFSQNVKKGEIISADNLILFADKAKIFSNSFFKEQELPSGYFFNVSEFFSKTGNKFTALNNGSIRLFDCSRITKLLEENLYALNEILEIILKNNFKLIGYLLKN